MPEEDLGKYSVLLSTNRGNMLVKFWPEVAPNHVRNFLDLCEHGFYDGLSFHRVIPGFMIQGGDPKGDGTGGNDRKVDAEFSRDPKYKHVRGVLSMARLGHDVNSATSQFFLMHATYPSLDGQYSAFGKLEWGEEVIDLIVNVPTGPNNKPLQKQYIKFAKVLLAE
ncbi:MAG: peptidylprolyl isomerase [Planctomycetes bacterium]|nr:peptidylprolyl isomerase [Planctomycetota bacterium]